MKREKRTNGSKPVTFAQFNKHAVKTDRRFDEMDRRFDILETRFEMSERRFIVLNAKVEKLTERIDNFDKKFQDFITKMYDLADASLRRAEENAREILFLGRQHDDLANYCTKKIAYPPYGGGGIATKSVGNPA